jgi:hypothetical protein
MDGDFNGNRLAARLILLNTSSDMWRAIRLRACGGTIATRKRHGPGKLLYYTPQTIPSTFLGSLMACLPDSHRLGYYGSG